ncbi:MAG: hypothetical protein ACFFBD_17965, partial [Candidatus Hodarchaeota archaeon]
MANFRLLSHRLELVSRLSGLNLRLTAITLVGLTIGLSMLSATFIHLDSTRANYYISTLEETSKHDIGMTAAGTFRAGLWDVQQGFRNLIKEKIEEHSLGSAIKENTNYSPYFGIKPLHLIGISGLNDSILAECVAGSRLPRNQSEVVVYANISSGDPISLNDQINLNFRGYDYKTDQSYIYTRTLTVVGLLTPLSIAPSGIPKASELILLDLISGYSNITVVGYPPLLYNAYCFINSMKDALDLVQSIKTEIDSLYSECNFDTYFHFKYALDPTVITKDNAIGLVAHIYDFKQTLPYRYDKFKIYLGAWFYLLELELVEFNVLYPAFLLTTTPVFVIVALLVSFSLGLINERRQKALVLLKKRGISNRFIFFIMLIETIILAFCSAVFALVIGIPLTLFL